MDDDDRKEVKTAIGDGSEIDHHDCSLLSPDDSQSKASEMSTLSMKSERNQREERIIREALGFGGNADAKWCDARGQSGPSPADFGDHEPIPVDAVCASVVVSDPDIGADAFIEDTEG